MTKRLLAFALCLVVLAAAVPAFGTTALSSVPTINVRGVMMPRVGQLAGDNLDCISIPTGVPYTLSEVCWCHYEDNFVLKPDEAFEEGRYYFLHVLLTPKKGYTLEDATPLINGDTALVSKDNFPFAQSGESWRYASKKISASRIDTIGIEGFVHPQSGQTVAENLKNVRVPAGAHYTLGEIFWVKNDSGAIMEPKDKFESGKSYFLSVDLIPDEPYSAYEAVPQLNGSTDFVSLNSSKMYSSWFKGMIYILYSTALVSIDPGQVTTVSVNGFAPPKVGQTAKESVQNLKVPAGAPYTISAARWYDSVSHGFLNASDRFEAGKSYFLMVSVSPITGYSIADASAAINGGRDYVSPTSGELGTTFYVNSVNFNLYDKNSPGIPLVNVNGFVRPTAGMTVAQNLLNIDTFGADYEIEEMTWIDTTTHQQMTDSGMFEAGCSYYLDIRLKSKNGMDYASSVIPLINGDSAYVNEEDSHVHVNGDVYVLYSKEFEVYGSSVSVAGVNGFVRPTEGMKAEDALGSLFVPYGSHYQIGDACWVDDTDSRTLENGDRFAGGHTYSLRVTLIPDNGFHFAGTAARLNGSQAEIDTARSEITSEKIVIRSTGAEIPKSAKKGDVNGDGIVNAFDYQMVKAYVLGTFPSATAEMIAAMDVNGDGNINAFDYQMIKAAVLGTYTFS